MMNDALESESILYDEFLSLHLFPFWLIAAGGRYP